MPSDTVEVTANIDRFGRVLIPKRIRDGLGLRAGDEVVLRQVGVALEIAPARQEPALVVKEGVLVYGGRVAGDLDGVLSSQREARLERLSLEK